MLSASFTANTTLRGELRCTLCDYFEPQFSAPTNQDDAISEMRALVIWFFWNRDTPLSGVVSNAVLRQLEVLTAFLKLQPDRTTDGLTHAEAERPHLGSVVGSRRLTP